MIDFIARGASRSFAIAAALASACALAACGSASTAGSVADGGAATLDGGAAASDGGSRGSDGGAPLVDGGAAQSDGGPTDAGAPDAGADAGPPLGAAIDAADLTWTFVDFPDSTCDEGTPTGLGINKNSASNDVVIFFAGGGACWDTATCQQLNTSTHGPYRGAQFTASLGNLGSGTIFDRNSTLNPFKTFNYVIVPYCTGDLHAGSADATYDGGVFHHRGRTNALAFAKRVGATFRNPGKVVIAGSSTGGFGALLNAPLWREYFPAAKLYVIDDSAPFLVGDAIPATTRAAWFSSWNLAAVVDPTCGQACRNNLAAFYPALAARLPGARIAVISSLQDNVIRALFSESGTQLESNLTALANDVLTPLANVRYFLLAGQSHTTLLSPSSHITATTELWDWLTWLVTDSASWTSKRP